MHMYIQIYSMHLYMCIQIMHVFAHAHTYIHIYCIFWYTRSRVRFKGRLLTTTDGAFAASEGQAARRHRASLQAPCPLSMPRSRHGLGLFWYLQFSYIFPLWSVRLYSVRFLGINSHSLSLMHTGSTKEREWESECHTDYTLREMPGYCEQSIQEFGIRYWHVVVFLASSVLARTLRPIYVPTKSTWWLTTRVSNGFSFKFKSKLERLRSSSTRLGNRSSIFSLFINV